MRTLLLTVLLTMLTLTTSADEVTTNNVLNQTFTSGNNWTGQLSSNHGTSIIAGIDEGYVENTEAYSLVDDVDISADQLNNGFTSNQSAKVWFWNSNDQDVVMKQIITNSDGNVTTQTKTVTGSCATFNGCSYQNTGNNTYSIGSNTQTDFDIKTRFEFNSTPAGSASYSGSHNAADLKQPVLTITYDDTVIEQDASDALDDIEETLEDLQEEVFEDMEEFIFEEETFTFNEEPQFEMEMEMEMETFTFAEEFIEEFFMEMDEEFFMEDEGMEFEDGPMFEFTDTEMEEIYEETEELVETFLPMVSEEEEFSPTETFTTETFEEEIMEEEPMMTETFEEEEMIEEEPMMTETFEEEEMVEEEMTEEPTEMAEEEMVEEENTEMAEEEAVEEEPTEMVQAEDEETFEEEAQEEESTSEATTTSTVQSKKLAKQKKIQQKKAIVKNLARIMDKVDKDIKDVAKNLAIKNIIKMAAMTSEQASLDMYQNTVFYKPKDIYLDQLNIFDNRQIYPNTSLASYIQNDKIEIKARKLNELNIKKQKLLMELKELKNG